METLLYVRSSLFGESSATRRIADEFIATWQAAHPGAKLIERDLVADAIPHLGLATLSGLAVPESERSPAQAVAVAYADALIAEVEAAGTIVLAAPMYNFSIPSVLKAWIDHIARAGRTFRYTPAGPQGLLGGRKVFIVTGRGGVYSGESAARSLDFQEPYLRAVLGFLGLDEITFIHIEGLKISPEAAQSGMERARAAIRDIAALALVA
jgi:FMN-dependent NADH-azoreductase